MLQISTVIILVLVVETRVERVYDRGHIMELVVGLMFDRVIDSLKLLLVNHLHQPSLHVLVLSLPKVSSPGTLLAHH